MAGVATCTSVDRVDGVILYWLSVKIYHGACIFENEKASSLNTHRQNNGKEQPH